ncbi:MAG: hypothetical protein ABII23_00490 [bacterium]
MELRECAERVFDICKNADWYGYDPYDGLNSVLFQKTPFFKIKIAKQIVTQAVKNSPFNVRPLLLISKGRNSKALALFAAGLLRLFKCTHDERYAHEARSVLSVLESLIIKGYSGACWGYNFPWQSRQFYAPRNTPNAICTTFAAQSFLDAYDVLHDEKYLAIAEQSARFIVKDLHRTEHHNLLCFSYTPLDHSRVHNVNLLAAFLLARVGKYNNSSSYMNDALRAALYSIDCQHADGSWFYGTASNQKWIDGFHTGYNIAALKSLRDIIDDNRLEEPIKRGLTYYDSNFFLHDGTPRYYHDNTYPIDIHSAAQGMITYCMMSSYDKGYINKAEKLFQWTITNMLDASGYFYFQKKRLYTIKIPYIRWAQAWMYYAITFLIYHTQGEQRAD